MTGELRATDDRTYTIGIVKTSVSGDKARFGALVDRATEEFKHTVQREALRLDVQVTEFKGPRPVPSEGTFTPMDFLQLGVTEKAERQIDFLLVVTDVDLSGANHAFGVIFPSQLVNVGIISTRRLSPRKQDGQHDQRRVVQRLAALLLHTFGHLLNLPSSRDPGNMMFAFHELSDLEGMQGVTREQVRLIRRNMPLEARDESTRAGKLAFTVKQTLLNLPDILRAVLKANPLRLAVMLPAMFTAALSVNLVYFFTAEIWDIANTVELYEMLLFSVAMVTVGAWTLFQGFSLRPPGTRQLVVTESLVVSRAAALLSLTLTVLVFYGLIALLTYFGTLTIFPRKLMETWTTAKPSDPGTDLVDHLRLALFLGAIAALAGPLGALSDRSVLFRRILFIDVPRS